MEPVGRLEVVLRQEEGLLLEQGDRLEVELRLEEVLLLEPGGRLGVVLRQEEVLWLGLVDPDLIFGNIFFSCIYVFSVETYFVVSLGLVQLLMELLKVSVLLEQPNKIGQ